MKKNQRIMDFHHLKIFAAVYQYKSFTRASEQLNISQPTISEHIKNLEAEFSCRLFDRLGRRIAPTPKADRLYPEVIRLLDELEKLSEDFLYEDGLVRGNLIIGASTIPGTYILPALAARFRAAHPDTAFEIIINDTSKIADMVLNHEIFIGVVGARKDSPLLQYRPFSKDELVFVRARDYQSESLGTPLADGPVILREEGSGTRVNMLRLLALSGIEIKEERIAAILGSSASVKEAVRAGLGISCLSRLAVQDELARGEFIEIPLPRQNMRRDFYLIRYTKRTMPNHYQAFWDYLRQTSVSEAR
ncbi:Transcriptional regulator, LysR family [hydrothermal vent metagenome]|uniref:Transcriptional regulator, LysR family n=1 Tax=hydrothermal vent metagenome TaxID=652676 RepID=A0A3B0V8A0_9ZZZZ